MKSETDLTASVLLVDDEPELTRLLKWQLEKRSHAVVTALSGEEALSILSGTRIDVLVADIRMPGMDGIELIKRGLGILPDLQCIVITGHGEIGTAVEAMRLGAVNYLRKPVGVDELDVAIGKGMEKIRLIREVADKQAELEKSNARLMEEREKLAAANRELSKYRTRLEELLEIEIVRRRKAENDLARVQIRDAVVEVMTLSLRNWEQVTGETRIDLAEKSRIWTVSLEKNGPRTRTLEKYLSLARLPENIRTSNVLNTGYFVLKECSSHESILKCKLEEKLDRLESLLRRFN